MQATLGEAGLAGIRHMALSLVRRLNGATTDNEQLERVNKAAQQEVDELSAALEEARQTARSLQLEANQAADAVSTHQSASHASATSSGTWSSSRSAPQTARPPRLS